MYLDILKTTVKAEMSAIQTLLNNMDDEYELVCKKLHESMGKVVFMGVGKSGHVAQKLAATFASTGTPSFFIHGTEALHGDLGMIEKKDMVVLLSNSGDTPEIVAALTNLEKIGCKTVGFTANRDSFLAKNSDYKLIYPITPEADYLGLAPTASTTTMLVLGDAIACALSKAKDFKRKDFHKFHPGGRLGKLLEGE